jgi:hypothetical protein
MFAWPHFYSFSLWPFELREWHSEFYFTRGSRLIYMNEQNTHNIKQPKKLVFGFITTGVFIISFKTIGVCYCLEDQAQI